ncbi:MAG TPA: citryl-CoA lyase [Paucimonas sp.]|nr:citryl-CoA lyase [Paucimonas sp.]
MSSDPNPNAIRSSIWLEVSEPDNPFAAKAAYCGGYDVYGEMLGDARWVEMLYLLFRGEAPDASQANLLEALAVALANPGPRDPSVHAAMCGGVCGSTAASSLMAALAVGAGGLSGGREVFFAMRGWAQCGTALDSWRTWFDGPHVLAGDVWPEPEHPPGFDPYGVTTSTPVKQTLACLARLSPGPRLPWLQANLAALESMTERPLALSGVAAAAFSDLEFAPEQGEMLHLLLRLPGAAAHALEQKPLGYKKFPFGTVELEPGSSKEEA